MKTKIYLLFSLLLFAQSFVAQELSLIKDISTNASIKSSNPSYFTKINDKIYFAADDQINGQELWISDGTEQGTFMLKDINIGEGDSSPNGFTAYNGKVYFKAFSNELWETDGTEQGTKLIKKIDDGDFGVQNKFIVFNNLLFFAANDIINGEELWVSDGTEQGTRLFKDINLEESEGSNPNILSKSSNPNSFTIYNNKLFFAADDGLNGRELWKTDGTVAGTIMINDIKSGASGSSPSSITVFNNFMYFSASEGIHGAELWKSDGTINGTELVKDINFGESSSVPGFTDGVNTGGNTYNQMVVLGNELFFTANVDFNFSSRKGIELWKTDGTEQGTVIVKDILEGSSGSVPVYLKRFENKIYFSAKTGSNNGLTLKYLWESDGTEDGTKEVKDVNNNSISYPEFITVFDNKLFFAARDENLGIELFSFNPNAIDSNNNQTTAIPDNAFEQYLIDENLDSGDLDGKVLTANIENVTDLNLFNLEITDLTGIQDFTSLVNLDISSNTLNTLDVSKNVALEFLYCSECSLSSLGISKNINLKELSVFDNNLTTLDVSANTNLEVIDVAQNQLTNIDVTFNTNLISLRISNNQISVLNVSSNTTLEELNCTTNQLTNLDLSTNTNLTKLLCASNNLSQLNIKNGNNSNFSITNGVRDLETRGNPNLSCIQVDDVNFATTNFTNIDANTTFNTDCSVSNGFTFVPDDNFEQALIDLQLDDVLDDQVVTANIEGLISLEIFNKGISDLKGIEDFTALKNLNVNSNNLTALDTKSNLNLEVLICSENQISNLNILDNAALKELIANNNQLTTIETSGNFDLQRLEINNNQLETLNLLGNYSLLFADCSFNNLTGLEVFSSFNLTDLICNNNQIKRLELNGLSNLKTVTVNDNNLFILSLSGGSTENIESFNALNNENLFCIEVDNVSYAETNFTNKDAQASFSINCNNNEFTFVPDDLFEQALIDLGYDDFLDDYVTTVFIKNLKSLTIENINIDDLTGLEAFVSLETLILKDLSIDEIDLSTLTNLKNLNLFRNLLPTIDVSNNVMLEEFYASENSLTSLDLSNNINLEKLNLDYNEFTSLDISNNTKLKVIDVLGNVQGNQITTIDFSQNTLLEEIQLQGNLLTEIDVTNNTNLTRLSLPNNNISSIDVSSNLALERLSVTNNNLTSLDVSMLENLQFLYTSSNNLNCISVFDVAYANEQFTQFSDSNTIFVASCSDLVYVPDNLFEQKLIDLGYDTVLNDYVDRNDIKDVTSLEIENTNIDDLTGLEAFVSLETLILKDLSIDEINLSTLTNLKHLNLFRNLLPTIDVSSNILLEELYASENSLSTLDLSNNINLEKLNLDYNEFTSLDISNSGNLKAISILGNALGNQITTIDFSQNPLLEEVQLQGNLLTEIDVTNNTNLKILRCASNNLASLNLANNRLLETLICSNNNLSVLSLLNNIRLTNFNATNNNLTCINVFDVDFATTNWSDKIDDTASFGDDCYTEIPDVKFEQALIDKGFDNVIDGFVVTSNINTIDFISLSAAKIDDLTGIQDFTALTGINLKGNNLTSVDLSANTQLNNLNISNNFLLDRLDISNNTSLVTFEAFNAELTCIKVWNVEYANTNWSNKVDSDVVFSLDCNDVWTVDVDDKTQAVLNNVSGLDANNDGKITIAEAEAFGDDLDLSNKNLDDIKGLQSFSNIKSLNLSGNNLKDLSALTGKKITLISKTTGKKRTVEAKTSGLETLIISNNSFETLNLEELKNLKVIDLSDNPNVGTISIKNGNNANITSFKSTNTPNLSCIIVDDTNATYLNNFNKDANSKFVADLVACRSSVLSTEEFLQKDVKVFPNPVTNFLTVESSKEFDFIEIYNAIGKRILKTSERKIDFSTYTSGIYIMRIIAENKVLTKKVIKN